VTRWLSKRSVLRWKFGKIGSIRPPLAGRIEQSGGFPVCSTREGCDIPERTSALASFGRHSNSRERALEEVRHAFKVFRLTRRTRRQW